MANKSNAELWAEVRELRSTVDEYEELVNTLQETITKLEKTITKLEAEKRELAEEIEDLGADLTLARYEASKSKKRILREKNLAYERGFAEGKTRR